MPFPENTPTPDDLPSLSAAEVAALPVELLAILQREIDERLKRDKAAKTRFDAGLAIRYATRASEERQAGGKDTGIVRFDDGDFTVVADLPKRVDWDQDRLADMVARIRDAGDDPAEYVDLAYKVPERKYVAWPEAIRQGFEPARTVRPGKWKAKYRMLHAKLIREGFKVNVKVVERIYREVRLWLRRTKRKKIPREGRERAWCPIAANQRWSLDFTSDALAPLATLLRNAPALPRRVFRHGSNRM